MRLLKIIIVIFLIYFIRRFIQMYRAMQQIQEENIRKKEAQSAEATEKKNADVVEANFKVID